jgi:hypothetical protein
MKRNGHPSLTRYYLSLFLKYGWICATNLSERRSLYFQCTHFVFYFLSNESTFSLSSHAYSFRYMVERDERKGNQSNVSVKRKTDGL